MQAWLGLMIWNPAPPDYGCGILSTELSGQLLGVRQYNKFIS